MSSASHFTQRGTDPIYLDTNATTPIDLRVAEAMRPYLTEHFGNPSSRHIYGERTRLAIAHARSQVAQMLHCQDTEVLFTSGGTESNNTVLQGVAELRKSEGKHIILSAVEHPAIDAPCAKLEQQGFRITRLGVDSTGRVSLEELEHALTDDTILVSIMHANNEVGTLQPIAEIGQRLKKHTSWFHTDASQSVGKVPVHVDTLNVDFLTIAGHKLYTTKGVGALYIRSGYTLPSFMLGAGHETGRRAGTENVLQIVGLGKAAQLVTEELEDEIQQLTYLRDKLWSLLEQAVEDIQQHGHPTERLPNTLHIGVRGVQGFALVEELQDRVAVSAGSACHANEVSISKVLRSMKIQPEFAQGSLRISLGRHTTQEDILEAAQHIIQAIQYLRR